MSARLLALACLLWAPHAALAFGQVVQLPTFRQFSVQTSVLAPDRGGTHLGGVGRSSRRHSAYGVPGAGKLPGLGRVFGNRALDQAASAGNASVHATIIDHQELDQAVLAEAARRRSSLSSGERRAGEVAHRMHSATRQASTAEEPLLSVAELRRRNEARRSAEAGEAARLFAQGQQAETRGQSGTARIFYRMAQTRAEGELLRHINVRLAALNDQ